MPGYQVIGFEHRGSWLERWNWTDALHCRVRAIWDPEMLYMAHRRVDRAVAPAEAYPIEVQIRDHSHAGLIRERLELSWRLRGEHGWRVIPLRGGDPGTFFASIPVLLPVEAWVLPLAADRSGLRNPFPDRSGWVLLLHGAPPGRLTERSRGDRPASRGEDLGSPTC
jgi:hypothetical protein